MNPRRSHPILRRRYGYGYPPAHAPAGARYVLYALTPKKGGGHLKKRYRVGRARDAYEALARLYEITEEQRASGASGQGRSTYIIVDEAAKRGRIAPVVTADELRQRQAAGG